MDNKVVVKIEVDLETLDDAVHAPQIATRNEARIRLTWAILGALPPEDYLRLEKYQKGE